MTRLVRVELSRFRSRQAVVLLVLAGALIAGVLAFVSATDTRPLTSSDRRDAAAQADMAAQGSVVQQEVDACRQDPTTYLGGGASAADCLTQLAPSAASYYPREPLSLSSLLRQNGTHLAVVLIGLLLIAGCTFAGADWASGSMSSQLVFVPGRLRAWAAKAAAVALGSAAVSLVVLGAFWLTMFLVASSRGLAVPAHDVSDVAWHVVRAIVLAAGAAVGAFAATMVFRHTVTTLGLLFLYSVGGEILVNVLPVTGIGRWSLATNVYGWLAPRHTYFDATVACSQGSSCSPVQVMGHLPAGIYLLVLLVIVSVVSVLVFRRRDV